MSLSIAIAQMHSAIGDIQKNQEQILNHLHRARHESADLLLTPELALTGYGTDDLLLVPSFQKAVQHAIDQIIDQTHGITLILGTPYWQDKKCYNAALVIQEGQIISIAKKNALPCYQIFDEPRYFSPGMLGTHFTLKHLTLGVALCEDLWVHDAKSHFKDCDALLHLNASPFAYKKQQRRLKVLKKSIKNFNGPLVYCNSVGHHDGLLFDGRSFVLSNDKGIEHCCPLFEETLSTYTLFSSKKTVISETDAQDEVHLGLVYAIRSYVEKNNFQNVFLGLSGGLDSALLLCLIVDALGPQNVCPIALPGPYSNPESEKSAYTLCKNLGLEMEVIDIQESFHLLKHTLHLESLPENHIARQNLQARLRGLCLMTRANASQGIVLNTSNKSEMAMGYSTLYGDLIGALAPLGDLYKTEVIEMAKRHYKHLIPNFILNRPPSAELAPNQKDEDHLPPYASLDAKLDALLTHHGCDHFQHVFSQAYKRDQAPRIVRISESSLDRDWKFPLNSYFDPANSKP